MKKIFYLVVILFLTASPALSLAVCTGSNCITNPLEGTSDITSLVTKLVKVAATLGGVVCVFFIIYSGFLFVKAQGNPEEIKTAKNALLWSVIGAAVLLGASAMSTAICTTVNEVTGSSLSCSSDDSFTLSQ